MKKRHFDFKTVFYSVALFTSFTFVSSTSHIEDEYYDYYDDGVTNSSLSNITDEYSSSSSECSSISSTLREVHQKNRHLPLSKNVPHLNDTMQIIDHLNDLATSLIALEFDAEQIAYIFELFYSANVSNQCFLSLAQVGKGIFEKQIWALRFIDAWGKVPTGIAEGSVAHFGEFDQCLEIFEETNKLRGQYCLAKFILPYPSRESYKKKTPLYGYHHYRYMVDFFKLYNLDKYFTVAKFIEILNNQKGQLFRLGICFPSACSPSEIEGLLNQVLYPITKMPVELEPDCFNSETKHQFNNFELASISIIFILLSLNITCTLVHWFHQPSLQKNVFEKKVDSFHFPWMQAVKCFSMIKNTKALFYVGNQNNQCASCYTLSQSHSTSISDISQPKTGSHRFVFLDVIRFFLVLNVCVDHMFLFTPFMSFPAFKRILNSVITKVFYYNKYFFVRNLLIIDTLFMISGLVLSYTLFRKLVLSNGKMSYGVFCLRLWLKYSLPMGFVILLFWILPITGDGPIWNFGMNLLVPVCKDSFSLFSSFAYFSNYNTKTGQDIFKFDTSFSVCNAPTWFLSALFQLQNLGFFFVYIIYRNAKFGFLVNSVLVIFGCYASISPNLLLNQKTYFDGLNINSLDEMVKAFVAFHMGINQYIVAFFTGIIVGYLVNHQLIYKRFILARQTEMYLWAISIVTLFGVGYWFNSLHRINQTAPRVSILLWFSIGKLMACISIAWILFSLCVGRAVFIEKIFSLSFFRVMSRLTFGIYLLHFIPLTHRLFTVRDTYVMTDKILFECIVIDFMQTTFLAMVFHITVERPFNSLVSLIFDKNNFENVLVDQTSTPEHFGTDFEKTKSASGSLPVTSPSISVTLSSTLSPQAHCPSITQIKSLPSANLFAANCHDVYLA